MMKLYKYLPARYIDNVISKGELLFRNLTYFRQYEDIRRGDPLEGFHRDNPDNDITLSCPHTGRILAKGDFSFLNSTNTDLIFIFCLSRSHLPPLYEEFNADCCIEILDSNKFIQKTRNAIRKLYSCHKSGLICKEVEYYYENAPAKFNIKDPKNLAFTKGCHYEHQEEFRMIFGTKNAFNLTQQIVDNKLYDFTAEAKKGTPKEKIIRIGTLHNIVKIHHM